MKDKLSKDPYIFSAWISPSGNGLKALVKIPVVVDNEDYNRRYKAIYNNYKWVNDDGLAYFRSRITLAERDVMHGLAVTLEYFTTRAQQERALEILQFKLDVLWSISDAIEKAYP